MSRHKKRNNIDKSLSPADKYGVYLGYLRLIGWVNLPGVAILYFIGLMGEYGEFTGISTAIFFACLLITILCLILSFFKSITEKFQVLVYLLISVEFLVTMIWFDFLGLASFLSNNHNRSGNSTVINMYFFLIPLSILFIVAMIAFYFYHKNEMVVKLNNHFYGGQEMKHATGFGTVFGFVMLGRSLFEGNVTFEKILGIIVAVLLTTALPAGIMGGLFSAVYIQKHPECKEVDQNLEQ